MAVSRLAIEALRPYIGDDGVKHLAASAARIDAVDQAHEVALDKLFDRIAAGVVASLKDRDGLQAPPSGAVVEQLLERAFLDHWRDTTAAGIAEASPRVNEVGHAKLAQRKKPRMGPPRTLRELRELYDYFVLNADRIPKRHKKQAAKIKALYLKKIRELMRTFADVEATAEDIVAAVKKSLGGAVSRAKVTIATESTRNYNDARRAIYDTSADVTHYLFVCVRDFATTKWCKSRDKLVYKKGTVILDRETPPIHWNCRSELLPLTMQNPAHARLIKDISRWRSNNRCEPLPPGWVRAAAA